MSMSSKEGSSLWLVVLSVCSFAVPSFGDEYNFYFQKPKGAPNADTSNVSSAPDVQVQDSGGTSQAVVIPSPQPKRPKWSFGLNLAVATGKQVRNDFFENSDFTMTDLSGAVGLYGGYRFLPWFKVQSILATQLSSSTAGSSTLLLADAEFLILRLNVGKFDLIEIGPLAGGSLGGVAGSGVHIGVRGNLNAGPHVSLTLGLRGNGQFTMSDFGVTVNI